jgi:hypothetical protein
MRAATAFRERESPVTSRFPVSSEMQGELSSDIEAVAGDSEAVMPDGI